MRENERQDSDFNPPRKVAWAEAQAEWIGEDLDCWRVACQHEQ